MRERPILFSGPMVRAILEGRKTQTRRVVKPQPENHSAEFPSDNSWLSWDGPRGGFIDTVHCPEPRFSEAIARSCPYGQPGDRLWVRETWTADSGHVFSDMIDYWWHELPASLRTRKSAAHLYYQADESSYHGPAYDDLDDVIIGVTKAGYQISGHEWEGVKWRPSIHMPRWASRLTLEITEVRVQRLQEISKADCEAEGLRASVGHQQLVQARGGEVLGRSDNHDGYTASMQFIDLWDSLNAKRGFGWDKNPYVWAISFKRLSSGNQGGS